MLMIKAPNRTLNSYSHYTTTLLVINACTHELFSPRMLISTSVIEITTKNEEDAIIITNE
jgi:hypothetical protein